jgi:hypothetical protein
VGFGTPEMVGTDVVSVGVTTNGVDVAAGGVDVTDALVAKVLSVGDRDWVCTPLLPPHPANNAAAIKVEPAQAMACHLDWCVATVGPPPAGSTCGDLEARHVRHIQGPPLLCSASTPLG